MRRANVVAERIPDAPDLGGARAGQALERWIASEERVVLRDDALHLRLLENDLRDEDVIRIVGGAPRQVATVAAIPREQASMKPPATSGIGMTGASHGGIVTGPPAIAQVD